MALHNFFFLSLVFFFFEYCFTGWRDGTRVRACDSDRRARMTNEIQNG